MASILEQVDRAEVLERGQRLTEYRELLTLPDPKPADADRLREVARELGFDLARLAVDQAAVAEFARLSDQAADATAAEAELNATSAAADKHRTKMQQTVRDLEAKQAELDQAVASARARTDRVRYAKTELRAIREQNASLFEGVEDPEQTARRVALESKAAELPGLRAELEQAQSDLEEAEEALDKADAACHRIPPNHADKSAVIQAKESARRERDRLQSRIADLHLRVHEARQAGEALEEV